MCIYIYIYIYVYIYIYTYIYIYIYIVICICIYELQRPPIRRVLAVDEVGGVAVVHDLRPGGDRVVADLVLLVLVLELVPVLVLVVLVLLLVLGSLDGMGALYVLRREPKGVLLQPICQTKNL